MAWRQVYPGDEGAQKTVNVGGGYQILPSDDIISVDGEGLPVTVIAPLYETAFKEFTISAVNGAVTLLAEVPIEFPPEMTTRTAQTFFPARDMWNHK